MTKEQAIVKLLEQHGIEMRRDTFVERMHYNTVVKTLLERGWYTFDDGDTKNVSEMVVSYQSSILDMLRDYDLQPRTAQDWLELSMQCNEVAQMILLLGKE